MALKLGNSKIGRSNRHLQLKLSFAAIDPGKDNLRTSMVESGSCSGWRGPFA
jgi:hypothetical protein